METISRVSLRSTRSKAEREAQKTYRHSRKGRDALNKAQRTYRHKVMLKRLECYELIELQGGVKMKPHEKKKLAMLRKEFKLNNNDTITIRNWETNKEIINNGNA